jgi:hypothetical protein
MTAVTKKHAPQPSSTRRTSSSTTTVRAIASDDRSIARLLSTAEAAERLNVQPQTLRAWRSSGVGPVYVRLGHKRTARVGYREADLASWLEARSFTSTAQEVATAR